MENYNIFDKPLPRHIGIIMDGNGRWAKKRNLPRSAGHKKGAEVAENIIETCVNWKIEALSLYAFSTENWKRSEDEISNIFKILDWYIENKFTRLMEGNIKLRISGDISKFSEKRQRAFKNIIEKTSKNSGLILNVALNYGARDEILTAINEILHKKYEKVDYDTLSKYLYTAGMPDVDLLIRPSGELRLSNFLLLQSAYAELWFSDILWPDFKSQDLERAIYDYQNRERRFGGVNEGIY